MAVLTSVAPNPTQISKVLLTTATGALGPYRYRGGQTAPDSLRIHVADVGSAGTWSVDLKVTRPGGAVADAVLIETYTADASKVFEPAGDADIYLDCTAHGGTSTLELFIFAGPR